MKFHMISALAYASLSSAVKYYGVGCTSEHFAQVVSFAREVELGGHGVKAVMSTHDAWSLETIQFMEEAFIFNQTLAEAIGIGKEVKLSKRTADVQCDKHPKAVLNDDVTFQVCTGFLGLTAV